MAPVWKREATPETSVPEVMEHSGPSAAPPIPADKTFEGPREPTMDTPDLGIWKQLLSSQCLQLGVLIH